MAGAAHSRRQGVVGHMAARLCAGLCVLAVMGGIGVLAALRVRETTAATSADTSAEALSASDGKEAVCVLIITEDAGQAEGFVVVRWDGYDGVTVGAFPRETVVERATREWRLCDLYVAYGPAETREALAATLARPLTHYAVFSYDALQEEVDDLGNGIVLSFDGDAVYTDGEVSLCVTAGQQCLTGRQLTTVLRAEAQTARQAEVCAALIDQYWREPWSHHAEEVLTAWLDRSLMTDLRRRHIHTAREGLEILAQSNTGGLCRTVTVAGEYWGSGADRRFFPDGRYEWL